MIKGIDVSHHNDVNDWNAVKNDGISFVFLKATEGNNYVDPTFASYCAGARAVGLEVGAYHFARFANPVDAKMEADFFLQTIKGKDLTLPVVLDIETNDKKLDRKTLTDCVNAFCDTIQATGQKVIVYTYKGFMTNFEVPTDTLFWFARYGVSSPDVKTDFWQYDDKGHVSGISGYVDMDYYMGDDLPTNHGEVAPAKPAPVPHSASAPVKPAPNKEVSIVDYLVSIGQDPSFAHRKQLAQQYGISNYTGTAEQNSQLLAKLKAPNPQYGTYVVQRGDTFYEIAGKLGVHAQDLMKLNPTVKPRAMQIGSVLKVPLKNAPASKPAPKADQKTFSLVDYLISIGVDHSFANRQKLARKYGISNYSGTADQNLLLLKKMRGH